MNASKNIYCISGLGADEKAFERLKIDGYHLLHLRWLSPMKNESLSSYAKRMAEQIGESEPILIGLSFGGMVAIEIAKQMPVKKLVLISTAKHFLEIPFWMRLSGMLKLHKIIPLKSNRLTQKADNRRMGIETEEERALVDSYRKKADQKYVNWAVDQILTWKNTWAPEKIFHIHGANDRMFPIRNIRPTHVIPNGTHLMVLNRAEEVSRCIEEILSFPEE